MRGTEKRRSRAGFIYIYRNHGNVSASTRSGGRSIQYVNNTKVIHSADWYQTHVGDLVAQLVEYVSASRSNGFYDQRFKSRPEHKKHL